MKTILYRAIPFTVLFLVVLFPGCKKDPVVISPVVTTAVLRDITKTSAEGGGTIISDGGSAITARGVCWSTATGPTMGDSKTTDGQGTGSFTSSVAGLEENTTYYLRAYATNRAGTGYGEEVLFTTFGLIDIDGNGYHSVEIGTQVWMRENLKTTTYRDGSAIPKVTDAAQWGSLTSGAYCEYANLDGYVPAYGLLYNWYAVTESRQVCPAGWHASSNAEWDILSNFLGGVSVAGGKLKSNASGTWDAPNTGATNESGFSALPGGEIGDTNGGSPWYFTDLGSRGHWWTTSGTPSLGTWRYLDHDNSILGTTQNYPVNGKSVRCIKD